jgi:ABC-type amino acid transport substrate-binding protein
MIEYRHNKISLFFHNDFRSLRLTLALIILVLVPTTPHQAQAQVTQISASEPKPRDLHSIIADGRLRVAVTRFRLPGFRWIEGGRQDGPEAELARQIGSALGVSVDFVDDPTSFDAVVDVVSQGRADIGISKISQTYYRMLHVRFSDPYLTLRHSLLFNRATVAARSEGRPTDLVLREFGGKIGVISNSAYADSARRNFPRAEIVGFANWGTAIRALQSDAIDAVYRDEFEVQRILKLSPTMNVRFGAAVITDQLALLSVAICDTCARLQDLINYHLAQTAGAFSLPALLASDLKD